MNHSIFVKSFPFILFLFCSFPIFSQSGKGSVFFAVKPSDAIIRLDTTLIRKVNVHIPIDTGMHIVKIWAPGYMLLTDTLNVSESKHALYRKKLIHTEAYNRYEDELQSYKRSRFLTKVLPGLITAGSALYFLSSNIVYKSSAEDNFDHAQESLAKYESATGFQDVLDYKSEYNRYYNEYTSAIDKKNKNSKMAAIVLPIEIAASTALFFLTQKLDRPVFEETPLLSGLSFNYQLAGPASGPRIVLQTKF